MAIQDNQVGTLAVPAFEVGVSALRVLLSGSLLFGILLILVTPPLRGPDETQHFLRAYGIAQGDFIPSSRDDQGRKGIFLPARLHAGLNYFESARETRETGYGPVLRAYLRNPPAAAPDAPPVFVPYAGSEGYSPIAYLPQSAAALVARALDLDFLATQYLMRLAGLIAMSAILAMAITLVPSMGWPLVVIAMLPAALYGRSVINADASALAGAIMVVALWLRGVLHPDLRHAGRQSVWMVLSALTKPPNVTLVMLELATPPDRSTPRWRTLALVIVPAVVVALLWSWASGGDTASWRMVEITGYEPASFDPARRLAYLLAHPLHFPLAVIRAVSEKDLAELWRQLIGVLGLFDTVLHGWVYPALTATLLASFVTRIPSTPAIRLRLALAAAATVFCYTIVVYFICYLVFTPLEADSVWGVQGRYFVPILPLVAIVVAALVNRAPAPWLSAALAVSAATLSGVASIAAIIDTDWN